jgi:hypothetical protein
MSAEQNISITEAELTKIENTLVTVREAIDQNNQSPEAQKIMGMIVESEQIISAKLDKKGTETTPNAQGAYSPHPPTG